MTPPLIIGASHIVKFSQTQIVIECNRCEYHQIIVLNGAMSVGCPGCGSIFTAAIFKWDDQRPEETQIGVRCIPPATKVD